MTDFLTKECMDSSLIRGGACRSGPFGWRFTQRGQSRQAKMTTQINDWEDFVTALW